MRIGVLALQGGFAEHLGALERAGVEGFEIRKRADLDGRPVDGLILPGGESTVIGRLLRETGLFGPVRERIGSGLPVFGTCAGMILLARHIINDRITYFGALDITGKAERLWAAAGQLQQDRHVCRPQRDPDDVHPRAVY